jgi:transcriptional regulator of acetoin/glycerol metabolism
MQGRPTYEIDTAAGQDPRIGVESTSNAKLLYASWERAHLRHSTSPTKTKSIFSIRTVLFFFFCESESFTDLINRITITQKSAD